MINSSSNKKSAVRNHVLLTHLRLFRAVGVVATFMQRAIAGQPWPKQGTPRRKMLTFTDTFQAAPEQIFPLLCPVREYDWIENWDCTVVYSRSGIAEKGCVFTTELALGETWVCSRYEPGAAIEFVINAGKHLTITFEATLEAKDGGTEICWTRTFTSLDSVGERFVDGYTQDKYDTEMARLSRMLRHYLTTGTCLETGEALVENPW